MRRARELLDADVAYMTLNDEERGDTYMRVTDGSVSARFQQLRLPLGAGLGGLVAQTAAPYVTADYAADARFQHTDEIDDGGRRGGAGRDPRRADAAGHPGARRALRRQPQRPPVHPRGGDAARLAGRARLGGAGQHPAARRDPGRAGGAQRRQHGGPPAQRVAGAGGRGARPDDRADPARRRPGRPGRASWPRCSAASWPSSTPTGAASPRSATSPRSARWPRPRRPAAASAGPPGTASTGCWPRARAARRCARSCCTRPAS